MVQLVQCNLLLESNLCRFCLRDISNNYIFSVYPNHTCIKNTTKNRRAEYWKEFSKIVMISLGGDWV